MFVSTTLEPNDAPNEPVPDTVVSDAGKVIVSNGEPDTTSVTPPVWVTMIGAIAGTDVYAYLTATTPMESDRLTTEQALPSPEGGLRTPVPVIFTPMMVVRVVVPVEFMRPAVPPLLTAAGDSSLKDYFSAVTLIVPDRNCGENLPGMVTLQLTLPIATGAAAPGTPGVATTNAVVPRSTGAPIPNSFPNLVLPPVSPTWKTRPSDDCHGRPRRTEPARLASVSLLGRDLSLGCHFSLGPGSGNLRSQPHEGAALRRRRTAHASTVSRRS
jgi:hypothetical protein